MAAIRYARRAPSYSQVGLCPYLLAESGHCKDESNPLQRKRYSFQWITKIQEPQERMKMGYNNTLSSSFSVGLTLGNVAGKQKNKVTPDTTDPSYRHKTVGAYYVILCLLAAAVERGWGERSFEAKTTTTTLAHTQTQLNWEGVCCVCVCKIAKA